MTGEALLNGAETYLQSLRVRAQSVLAAVQRLEELKATDEDFDYLGDPNPRLGDADADAWALVDWIEGGRCE